MGYNDHVTYGSNQDPKALLRIILVVVALIGTCAVAGVGLFLLASRAPDGGGTSGASANPAAFDPLAEIGSRPAPARETLDMALPPVVGGFSRISTSGNDLRIIYGSGVTATYSENQARVSVTAAIYGSRTEAQNAVGTAAARQNGNVTASTAGETAYMLATNLSGGEARLVWNRGVYVYDVQAPSRETLNRFMAHFPY